MVIECLVRLDGTVDRDRFARVVQRRVVDRFPVFRQHPVRPALPGLLPRWRDVRAFALADHIREAELERPGDDRALQDYLARFLGVPLRRDRPLWEMHLIEGRPEGTAIFLRLHHALADGIALARVLVSLTDEAAEASDDPRDEDPPLVEEDLPLARPAPGGADAARLAGRLLRRVGRVASAAAQTVPVLAKLLLIRAPSSAVSGVVVARKQVVWARAITLAQVKELAAATGTTVNDVLVSALAGGLERYQRHHGDTPVDLPTMIPVNLRPLDRPLPARLGNRFAVVLLRLASGSGTPPERLLETKRRMDRIKSSPEAVVTFVLMHLIGCSGSRIGPALIRFFAGKAIGVTTNVPGPSQQRYLAGSRVEALLGWVPGAAEQTVGTCIFTYGGQVHIGFKTDADAVPDPDVLLDGFHAELDALLATLVVQVGAPAPDDVPLPTATPGAGSGGGVAGSDVAALVEVV